MEKVSLWFWKSLENLGEFFSSYFVLLFSVSFVLF